MNNLYSEVINSVGFTRGISLEPEKFPVLLEDIIIKPNDLLTNDNYNFALSGLYQNFLSIVSDSYIYNPNIPLTNPHFDSLNNIVGTLCGTFVATICSNSGSNSISYYANGIPHSLSAYQIVYNTHDFTIKNGYLTLAVGILSATSLSSNLSANNYDNVLGLYNYSLSTIYNSTTKQNNSNFSNEGALVNDVNPNFGINTKFLNKNLNIKFTSITKLKFVDNNLYVLDSVSNKFLIYDVSNVLINLIDKTDYEIPFKTLGFATTLKTVDNKIKTFCINSKYLAFYNYDKNAITIFSNSLNRLYSYCENEVTLDGFKNTGVFADIEFDTDGNLYLLTEDGKIYVYTVSDTKLTLINSYNFPLDTTVVFSSLSAARVDSIQEKYKKISFSNSDENIFFVSSVSNVYKKFKNTSKSVGQVNINAFNTTYYSTLSNIADPFNTLIDPASVPGATDSFNFYKYKINSVANISYNNAELVSVCFIDNCYYSKQNTEGLGNVENLNGAISFYDAYNSYGINPVSASGITFFVDNANFINLNNQDLSAIDVYSFDNIEVKPDEFVSDFVINKSFRKLLFNIYNYQTYLTFKPVVDIDINNNPQFKNLEYILSYDKNLDLSDFDNFVGINEITSTIFLNRCFSKVYNLLESIQLNSNPRLINVFPRYTDSVLLNQTEQKFVALYNDSGEFVNGSYDTAIYPIPNSLCNPVPTPTPSGAPEIQVTDNAVRPIITPTISPTPTEAPDPTPTPTPAPTSVGVAIAVKKIKHSATVILNNTYVAPIPVAPYSNYKTLSAIYAGSGTDTIVSEITAFFDTTAFNQALSAVNGNYTKLIGRRFGDYVLEEYNLADNSNYRESTLGCIEEDAVQQSSTPTSTATATPTPTPTPTPSVTPSVTPSITPTITP